MCTFSTIHNSLQKYKLVEKCPKTNSYDFSVPLFVATCVLVTGQEQIDRRPIGRHSEPCVFFIVYVRELVFHKYLLIVN